MSDIVVEIKKFILRKLINLGKIGGSHTAVFNLSKGLPSNIYSNKQGKKAIQQAVDELIKNNWLLGKPSTGELHVSVNPRKFSEIKEFLSV